MMQFDALPTEPILNVNNDAWLRMLPSVKIAAAFCARDRDGAETVVKKMLDVVGLACRRNRFLTGTKNC